MRNNFKHNINPDFKIFDTLQFCNKVNSDMVYLITELQCTETEHQITKWSKKIGIRNKVKIQNFIIKPKLQIITVILIIKELSED